MKINRQKSLSRKRSFQPQRTHFDQLEARILLAADVVTSELVVVDEGWTDTAEQTRVIRVYNDGDHTVEDVHVRSLLSNELDNAEWTRSAAFGRSADFDPNPAAANSAFANSFFDLQPIGDVNGDGWLDGATRPSKYHSSDVAQVVFGGPAFDPSQESSNDSPAGFQLPGVLGNGVHGLGDINGDGFDDISHGNKVIFGSADLGATELDEAALNDAGFSLEGINQISAIGDINGDGLDDFSASQRFQLDLDVTYLIWGQESKEQLQSLSLDAIAADSDRAMGMVVQGDSHRATGIQDINGDGLADAAFERFAYRSQGPANFTVVIFGQDDVMNLPNDFDELDGSNGFGVGDLVKGGADFQGSTPVFATGDVNADGFADFAIGYEGLTDCFCTATDKESLQIPVGAAIVFGGPDVGSDGYLGSDEGSNEPPSFVQFSEHVLYDSRLAFAVVDINADGYSDFQVNDSVIFGGQNVSSLDLGASHVLNGENGFKTDSRFVSWISPTGEHLDETAASLLSHGGEIWRQLDDQGQVLASGIGEIDERFDLLPQTSFIYEITGQQKTEGQPIVTTIAGGPENVLEDLTNNVTPRGQSIVYLEVELTEPTSIDPGKPTSFEIQLTNHGPDLAEDLQVLESYSHVLESLFSPEVNDIAWTRTEQAFPSDVDLDDLATFGVGRQGRNDFSNFQLEKLARSIGAGDYNGDGIDDVFFSEDYQIQLSLGGTNFGLEGFKGTTAIRAEMASDIGDVNGDGFDDIMLDHSKILLGHAGVGDSDRIDINGSRVITLEPTQVRGTTTYAIGDINADGTDDFVITRKASDPWEEEREAHFQVVYGNVDIGESDSLSLDLATASGFRLTSDAEIGVFRTTVAGLGDTNGDGIDDFAIGTDNGSAYVVFGSQDRANEAYAVDEIEAAGGYRLELPLKESFDSEFEPTLAVAGGDINGDGLQDVLVGASWRNENSGEVYVVYGSQTEVPEAVLTNLGSSGIKIVGESFDDYMGATLSSGDINDDGFDDVIIGGGNDRLAFLGDSLYTGSVYVVYGGESSANELFVDSLDGQNGFRLDNPIDTELSTHVVAGFDVNADGVEDLFIGDPGYGDGIFAPTSPGAAYLIYGRAETSASGPGPIDDQISLDANAQVTYTITGTIPNRGLPAQLPGLLTLTTADSQINLNAASSAKVSAVAPTLPRQSPHLQQIVVSYLAPERLTKTSIGDDDIEVVLPNGESVIAEFVGAKVFSDRSLQATYGVEAIGGLWEASDNGTYEIHLRQDEVLADGVAIPPSQIGSFEVAIPEYRATAPDLTEPSPFGQRVSVFFERAVFEIDSIGQGDIEVVRPDGSAVIPALLRLERDSPAKGVTATYRFESTDGYWDAFDNGAYEIRMRPNAVRSATGEMISLGKVGEFVVSIESLAGDLNNDATVDFNDFLILAMNFGNTDATPEDGDFDLDGTVSFVDFLILGKNFGKQIVS